MVTDIFATSTSTSNFWRSADWSITCGGGEEGRRERPAAGGAARRERALARGPRARARTFCAISAADQGRELVLVRLGRRQGARGGQRRGVLE
jgi:hypothetical protein